MKSEGGLTLIEVLIALTLLAVIGVSMVVFMPSITSSTRTASFDSRQAQTAISMFERISRDWSNTLPWTDTVILDNGTTRALDAFVSAEMAGVGLDCDVRVESPSAVTKRVVLTCSAGDDGTPFTLRAEYGSPGA